MEGLFRRPSGVYFARLVVPARHRAVVGKRELLQSTGTRVLAVARIVGGEILARWRRRLHELDGLPSMDVLKLYAGSPALAGDGHLPLSRAAAESGIDSEELLRQASRRKLPLFYLLSNEPGAFLTEGDLERSGLDLVIPSPAQMPNWIPQVLHTGIVAIRSSEHVAATLLAGDSWEAVAFNATDGSGDLFAPGRPIRLTREALHVDKASVEALRWSLATTLTPEQIEAARTNGSDPSQARIDRKGKRLLSQAIEAFINDNSGRWAPDHRRRVEGACRLYLEFYGDSPVVFVDREQLRAYRSDVLPKLPAHENKIRLKFGTKTVTESMTAVAGQGWPTLSAPQQNKHMLALAMLFAWLNEERWIREDPALGLAQARKQNGEKKKRDQDRRDRFDDADLRLIFGSTWYRTGRGELTANGTYRTFCPYYYWLPLLGLYTGARINELCQLSLTDIRRSENGNWFIDITDDDYRRLKTANAVRRVPVHSLLLQLGLERWLAALSSAGYKRVFPELKADAIKGHSKAAVKWFSAYLQGLGMPRENRKVFHSFRHGLATVYINELRLPETTVNQLAGWSRGAGTGQAVYRKDELPDQLVDAVQRVRFNLPAIEEFDCAAGPQAVAGALRRKNRGRGASED